MTDTYGDTDSSVYAVRLERADCDADQHRHDTEGCHGHPRPDCTETGTYETIQGTAYGVGSTDVCDDEPACPAGEHRHGLRGCHDHPRPLCSATGSYITNRGDVDG